MVGKNERKIPPTRRCALCAPPAPRLSRAQRLRSLAPAQETKRAYSAESRPSRRLGWGTRPAPPGRWSPQGPPSPVLCTGVTATIQKPGCQTSWPFHVGRGAVVQVARTQGGAFFPSGSTAPPHPRPRKGHAHKNFCHAINIFAFPPTFPMGYQLQNS